MNVQECDQRIEQGRQRIAAWREQVAREKAAATERARILALRAARAAREEHSS